MQEREVDVMKRDAKKGKKEAADEETVAPAPLAAWVAMVLAWLFPGAGHLYLGRRLRAAVFSGVILCAVVTGVLLDGGLPVALSGSPIIVAKTLACLGMGIPYFVLRVAVGYTGDITAAGYEYGMAFLCTAGVMNLLLIIDVWDIGRGVKP